MRPALLLLLAALLAPSALAQPRADDPIGAAEDGPFVHQTLQVTAADIDLDGRLNEAVWERVTPATGFVQREPTPGDPASEPTEARLLYTASAIYIGMRMHDSQPDAIDARLARRDSDVSSDWAFVGIDSYNDDRTGFVFGVNAGGVQRDFLIFNDNDQDSSWDAVWESAVSRDAEGWTVEIRIPLSQLRFAASDGPQAWGIQFGRDHVRTGEESFWSPFLPDASGFVSQFGSLEGISGLRPPSGLEIQPYVAASLGRAPGDDDDPFYNANEFTPNVGVDVQYGLTSDLTLTATLNPDFGQVEADPAQVNLGAFELFFEERRPFFIEGTDIFSYGSTRSFIRNNRPNFLYTRRIGRSPTRGQFVPGDASSAGDVYTDSPLQTTILGAAKLSGRVGEFSVGVLNAVTANEYGRFAVVDAGGNVVREDRALVEPLSNYFVGRVKRQFGQTVVGGVLTAVNRDLSEPALQPLLTSGAYTLGLDFEHGWNDRTWILSGVLAGSRVTGSPEVIRRVQTDFPRYLQRPDADHLTFDPTRTALGGVTGELALTKTSGEHWIGSASGYFTSPGFDANALGFQSRSDQVGANAIVIYRQNQPAAFYRNWRANAFANAELNLAGDPLNVFVGGNLGSELANFWFANLNVAAWPAQFNDRLTRGGPVAGSPAGFNVNAFGNTDGRKPVSFNVWTGHSLNTLGGFMHGVSPGVNIRPSSSLAIEVDVSLNSNRNATQYVTALDDPAAAATFGRRYVFAQLDQRSLSFPIRVNWTFTPDLSLQLYARPFVTTGRYSNFRELSQPRGRDYPVYGIDQGTATDNGDGTTTIDPGDGGAAFTLEDPSFTFRSLQGNAVVRWEYRPGSTLFFVWQQQRSGFEVDRQFTPANDFGDLFSDPVENVFLVKLSYWLGA